MISLTSQRALRRVAPVERIAIVRALHLGDLLLAVPAMRALRAAYPHAEVTLIGLPWAKHLCRASRVTSTGSSHSLATPAFARRPWIADRTEGFLAEQRTYGYDVVIQMHGSGRASTPFALALGGRSTVGYYEGARPSRLTLGAPYADDQPEVIRNLSLVRLLTRRDAPPALEFPLFEDDRAEAAALLAEVSRASGPLVIVHAGARSPARRWPCERFATVADALAASEGARIVLTGGPDEADTVRAVRERMSAVPLDLSGRTSLGGLAAVIAAADLFIGNDTGPAHIAEAVGTPSVTIFGPADRRRWAPLDQSINRVEWRRVGCNPCGYWDCPIDHRCLRRIGPDAVLETARALLRQEVAACNG